MLPRHAISDADWERVKDLLPGRPGQSGWLGRDNRLFLDAVLWLAKTGAPWRDLPERFGNWNSVWRRFRRWAQKGTWQAVFAALQDPDLEWLILDSTVIRAHPCAAGAPKKRTAPAARPSRPWAAAGAVSPPKCTAGSAVWGCR
jgi:transposase